MSKSYRFFTAREELDHLEEVYGDQKNRLMEVIKDNLQILQTRSQTVLGLCTICLTITGFSGPRIAESGKTAAASVVSGLFFVVLSTLFIVIGPLRLQWITRVWKNDWRETAVMLLERRNRRTRLFTISTACLIIGMSSYMTGLALFLFSF